ncbi:MAG: aldehyde dehydrogenase family protein, partial [Trebonia sp.]|uniref:aldehyde dehydrogenase family protein n=1 Tax=Trebonia sp. TaxID=2767075 RepID=UPI003C8F3971
GQTCVGIERVYVVGDVYHSFLDKLRERVAALRPGSDREADYGPMTMASQVDVIEGHVADALARNSHPAIGGLDSIRAPYVEPVILTGVPEDSRAVTEETFGPTVTVTKVADLDEGVRLANGGRYGLGSAVYAKSRKRALDAARSLRTGMTAINSVIAFAGVPSLLFGGVADSGFGRIHGADGLREFARAKAITRQRMKPLVNLTTFARTDKDMDKIVALVTLLHGRRYR